MDGVPLVAQRRRLVAVVHDDDVAVGHAWADAVHHRIGCPWAEPVEVPQQPAPADHAVIDLLEAGVHTPRAPARVGTKRLARLLSGNRLDAVGGGLKRARETAGA